jgi:hypothetical protein
LFLKFLNSPRPPEDAAAALLGFAEDLKAAVQAWQQGQRVYLHPPRRMVRAIKRNLAALNQEVETRRNTPVEQPIKSQLGIANSRTLKVVTASCQNQFRPHEA